MSLPILAAIGRDNGPIGSGAGCLARRSRHARFVVALMLQDRRRVRQQQVTNVTNFGDEFPWAAGCGKRDGDRSGYVRRYLGNAGT